MLYSVRGGRGGERKTLRSKNKTKCMKKQSEGTQGVKYLSKGKEGIERWKCKGERMQESSKRRQKTGKRKDLG